jgi:TRAP-type C4-dicarboxylate transport system substrate-binding protein
MTTRIGRRAILAGAASLPLVAVHRARAADFEFKFATGQSPTNPINLRMQEAIDRIKVATGGKVVMTLFPNNQLGSDTDQISQLRAGGIDLLNVAGSVLSTLVPAAPLGDNGFRQITSSERQIKTPADLKDFHIRVPVSPIFTSLFQALGAAPTSINFNEVYTALQTKLVGGEENGLVTVETAKLYEVQKYCSETSHIWDSFCVLANRRSMAKLNAETLAIVKRELRQSALDQRGDEQRLDASLKAKLQSEGMTFIPVDKAQFVAALKKTNFYGDWKTKFGDQAWAALESVTGPLV